MIEETQKLSNAPLHTKQDTNIIEKYTIKSSTSTYSQQYIVHQAVVDGLSHNLHVPLSRRVTLIYIKGEQFALFIGTECVVWHLVVNYTSCQLLLDNSCVS